jgi:hypothetical protein
MNAKQLGIEKPSLKTADFLSFQIKREDWNLYELEDGTLLKARVLLANVLMEGRLEEIRTQIESGEKPKLRLTFNPRIIYAVEAPRELRGNLDSRTYTSTELKASIISEDMDFKTINESWNLYDLKNGITLKIRISATIVNKTSKYDNEGMPIYTVNADIDAKIELPEHLRKLIETREGAKKRRADTQEKPGKKKPELEEDYRVKGLVEAIRSEEKRKRRKSK